MVQATKTVVLFHVPAMSLGCGRNELNVFCTPTFCRNENNVSSKKKFIRCSRELVSHMNSLTVSTGVDMTRTEKTGACKQWYQIVSPKCR
jgi:hypothetical protein